MPPRKRTTVPLDARLHRALRLPAKATDCTLSEVIADALRQALSQEARNIQQAEALQPRRTISLKDVGARLKRLGVPTIIVEKNERAGDSWRKRYKSLCLHDPVWYDHMPYIPFPDDWPVFSPKDKLGDWLEMYAKVMELNYWGSTLCESASYDEARQEWTVKVVRNGKPVTLKPKQLVLATGMSAVPNMPKFPGMEKFKGEQHHSSKHPGPDAYAGKKCVVIGSNNSAHDICAALWEAGADVTMVQRSSTHVARSDSLMELDLGPVYSEQAVARGIDVDTADMLARIARKLGPLKRGVAAPKVAAGEPEQKGERRVT